MAIFKCKMCGGTLEINNEETVVSCEYCGTTQTVPKAMDENLQNLFNRANTLRIKSEFDKAEKLYEKIIQSDSTQSEAYWGLILCKYGIEYVDDKATFKKIPTCHRASYDSVIADEDYKSALENADISQRAIYEEQAKEIDRIQKEIIVLAQKEETFDVFICYKESDSDGKRTQDSVIANDIYHQLTQEGFKVFYAAITLEGKLGSAYEPIIYAALNSAKVMLSIGTKPEYFDAVWVKNEWSRFLKIIKKDTSKLLIPCYRDMDAYELPEEFAHLQAQDMSKIGFINDIVRGIKKVILKEETVQNNIQKLNVKFDANESNVAPLLKRAFMALEDEEFDKVKEFCEQVLNINPECVEAYLYKLMAELKVKKKEDLKDLKKPFDSNNNYQKIMRFADEKLQSELIGYNERNKKESAEAKKRNKKIAIIVSTVLCIIAFILVLSKVIIPNSKLMKVGDYISFGKYEQDNDESNGKEDIEWLILDKQDNKVLVVSKYALDCKQYHEDDEDVTWEDCTLRTWLNNDFINTAFSEDEKAKILTVTVVNDDNQECDTDGGNDTQDKVFLLSIDEVNKYFDSDEERLCGTTDYAKVQGADTSDTSTANGKAICWWWLRSTGYDQDNAAGVTDYGFGRVAATGRPVNEDPQAVRPALWINLES